MDDGHGPVWIGDGLHHAGDVVRHLQHRRHLLSDIKEPIYDTAEVRYVREFPAYLENLPDNFVLY
jgi:hypothetical protein